MTVSKSCGSDCAMRRRVLFLGFIDTCMAEKKYHRSIQDGGAKNFLVIFLLGLRFWVTWIRRQRIFVWQARSKEQSPPRPTEMAVDGAAARNQQPDIVRFYLQFPPVTRTLLTAIFVISICLRFNLISPYTPYTSFLGSFLRFFDAGWGLRFLITLITCLHSSVNGLMDSISAKLAS